MSYNTQQDILDFVEDNNVKFVRFAFCDIFGNQKNIAVLASDLTKALEDGVCFDGSAIAGFCMWRRATLSSARTCPPCASCPGVLPRAG